MRRTILALCAAAALLPLAPAFGQEERFTVAAGGLAIDAGDRVEIVSEDLYVSRQAVRIRYVLRNRSPSDVTIPIAFPLSDRTPERHSNELRWPSDIRIAVDGRPLALQPQRRALVGGQDHGPLLTSLSVPIFHLDEGYEPVQRALAALPPDEQSRLASMGLIEIFRPDSGPPQFSPLWTVRESWQWQQVVPAGRDLIVEHSYTPGLAGAVNVGMASDAIRNSESGRAQIRRYCFDDAFLAAVDRMAAPDAQGLDPSIAETWFTFLNGSGPAVGDYRLVVDRGDERTIASFCGEGAQAIGSTRMELRRTNWRPEGDLHVLFLAPEEAN